MSDFNYQLTIESKGIFVHTKDKPKGDDSGNTELHVTNGSKSKITYLNMTMELSLYGVSFKRKIYEPGHIQAEMLATKVDGDAPSLETLSNLFIHRPVSIAVLQTVKFRGRDITARTPLASGYYIHEISPQYEQETSEILVDDGNGGKVKKKVTTHNIYIKLDIFTPDKLLTLNKYSQTHLGKTLISDIVGDTLDFFPLTYNTMVKGVSSTETVKITSVKKALANLSYIVGSGATQKEYEFIHPYLVQYNESFYDFLRRTANRCGEPFYFEGGKLCFGINTVQAYQISGAKRIIYQRVSGSDLSVNQYARDNVKEWDSSSSSYKPGEKKIITDPIGMDDSGYPSDAFPKLSEDDEHKAFPYSYNSELASEDYYMLLYKDKFARDGFWDLFLVGEIEQKAVDFVSDILNSTSLMEFLVSLGVKVVEGLVKAGIKADKATKEGNKKVASNALDSSNDYAVMLAKVDSLKDHWITLKYYSDIRSKQEQQMRKMVCVDMAEGLWCVDLGDKFTLPNDNQTYVVVQIDMTAKSQWQRSYDSFFSDGQTPPAVQSQRIYGIPLQDGKFYPPIIPESPFRKSGPQPAFVLDSSDPTSQGRVRVRYAWEPSLRRTHAYIKAAEDAETKKNSALDTLKKYAEDGTIKENPNAASKETCVTATRKTGAHDSDFSTALSDYQDAYFDYCKKDALRKKAQIRQKLIDSGTPWIRMATPMATPGGGMYFKPEVGDEVMVDFENGNIERPYIVGTLYSKNVRTPDSGGSRGIVSKNGHTFKMSDPTDANLLLEGIFPAFKFLSSYGMSWQKIPKLEGKANEVLGGIELSDKYGLYSLKMSSHDRSISLSSPFGKVDVSALTGISIEAPNGDISITGKNVEISAYNKVSIESGKNILAHDESHDSWYSYFVPEAKTLGKTIGKAVTNMLVGKLLDLTIIRTLLEIFIRPVDGTLEIKSNRYLMLEAGEGSTAVESNMYQEHAWDTDQEYEAKMLVELPDHLSRVLNDYVHQYVQLYHDMVVKVQGLNTNNPWAGAQPSVTTPRDKEAFIVDMFKLDTEKVKEPELLAKAKDYRDKTVKFRRGAGRTDKDKLKVDRILGVMRAAYALKKHVAGYETLFAKLSYSSVSQGTKWAKIKLFFKRYPSSLANDIKSVLLMPDPSVAEPAPPAAPAPGAPAAAVVAPANIPAVAFNGAGNGAVAAAGLYATSLQKVKALCDNGVLNVADHLFSADLTEANYDDWKKFVLRRILSVIIEKCRTKSSPFSGFSIAPAKYEPVTQPAAAPAAGAPAGGAAAGTVTVATEPSDMAHPFSDADWAKYVNEIKMVPPPASNAFLSGFAAGFKGVLSKANPFPSEAVRWKHEAKGQILFSEEKGKSYHFHGESVERYDTPDEKADNLKPVTTEFRNKLNTI